MVIECSELAKRKDVVFMNFFNDQTNLLSDLGAFEKHHSLVILGECAFRGVDFKHHPTLSTTLIIDGTTCPLDTHTQLRGRIDRDVDMSTRGESKVVFFSEKDYEYTEQAYENVCNF